MKLLDRYIFWEWCKSFLLTFSAIVGVIIIVDAFDDLPDLLGAGASLWDILKFYIFLIPSFFPIIIPISLLVSLLFFLGNLRRNNEIVAFQASGLNLLRITRSLWFAGVGLTLLLIYFNANVIPWSVENTNKIENRLQLSKISDENDSIGMVSKLAFDNSIEGRLWYIHRFNQLSHRAYGVNIYNRNQEGGETSRVMAREAYFDTVEKKWILMDGREISFNSKGEVSESEAFDQKGFAEFTESPELMVSLSKKPKHLSLFQLEDVLTQFNHDKSTPYIVNYSVMYHGLLANPFSCLIVLAIAIPFAAFGVRTNPMVGVSKAIILFFVYYVIANIGGVLGNQLILSAWLAAWLPNFAMILFAIYLYRKVI